ncbi:MULTISPECIES: hypothetical protein [Rhizobium]|uniref:hypothetical protein n=1 Tax=Rhizobium TaxID=379 RepID=UPI0014427A8A|nr:MULTISPECIES: hypothetical protein [Rhizobium]KAF5881969.1 hypothetical protein FY112_27675 [Rhizobium sp. PEPV16]MBN9983164.1 hypothetical protein [Rhizobium laguerreae]MBY3127457.1 hypothetical protein [Rhizobium laguerreae]MBY5770395.1 hypothetical protein [Rhizobium leguminosarum]
MTNRLPATSQGGNRPDLKALPIRNETIGFLRLALVDEGSPIEPGGGFGSEDVWFVVGGEQYHLPNVQGFLGLSSFGLPRAAMALSIFSARSEKASLNGLAASISSLDMGGLSKTASQSSLEYPLPG